MTFTISQKLEEIKTIHGASPSTFGANKEVANAITAIVRELKKSKRNRNLVP